MTTAPHQVSSEDLRTVEDATKWRLVMTDPRPEARTEGMHAFYAKQSKETCPYPVRSPEWASWVRGYEVEVENNS